MTGKGRYIKFCRSGVVGSGVRKAGAARHLAGLCRIFTGPRNGIRGVEDPV